MIDLRFDDDFLHDEMKDFEHLLFNKQNSARILRVASFFKELGNQYY